MLPTRLGVALTASFVLLATGCVNDRYDITMRPTTDGRFERTMKWSRQSGAMLQRQQDGGQRAQLPPEEVNRLATLYGVAPPEDSRTFTAIATFDTRTPDDVGGAGLVSSVHTSLGSVHTYLERFRGQDDPMRQLERRNLAIDGLVDLVRGWANAEFGDEPGFGELEAFVDSELRRDVKNAAMIVAAGTLILNNQEPGQSQTNPTVADANWRAVERIAARLIQFFGERSYLDEADVRALMLVYVETESTGETNDPWTLVYESLRKKLIRELGREPNATLPKGLTALIDLESMYASLQSFVDGPKGQAMMGAWADQYRAQRHDGEPSVPDDPEVIVGFMLMEALGVRVLADYDALELRLHSPDPPIRTNGHWDERANAIRWSFNLDAEEDEALSAPSLAFAAIAIPNEAFQHTCFGEVLLRGADLGQYCRWRERLSVAERDMIDQALQAVSPDMPPQRRRELVDFEAIQKTSIAPPAALIEFFTGGE